MTAMPKPEVLRRLGAYLAMSENERPISLRQFGKLMGDSSGNQYRYHEYVSGEKKMGAAVTARMGKLFQQLENGQIVVEKGGRASVSSVKRPPVRTFYKLALGKNGPGLQLNYENPAAFPEKPRIDKA